MQADLITIGDEILIGQTVDTNSAWMSEALNLCGINVHRITSIADERAEILAALTEAGSRSSLVLITGGLGPTADDITKTTLAEYFDTELVRNEEILSDVKQLFSSRGFHMAAVNEKQADVPESCTPIRNRIGTAPGMWFEKDGTVYVSMPGVPYEMKWLMEKEVLPRVRKHFKTPSIIHETIVTAGIGESSLMEIITDWEARVRAAGISLAYLPSPGSVKLRLSITSTDDSGIRVDVDGFIEELYELIPQFVVGRNSDTLESVVGELLKERKHTLSTAESCTGGYLAHLITRIPGSSAYFMGSVVSYSNEVKERSLGVSWESLKNYGAVSQQVVEEMATGARRSLQTDYSMATSGIAGPGGGTEHKPVGTIWVAVAGPQGVVSKKIQMGSHRERNIQRTAIAALRILLLQLTQVEEKVTEL